MDFWNEFNEHFVYYLDSMRWKVSSEHSIDNHQYSAELQIVHKQFATNHQVIISVLFDEELFIKNRLAKPKTCFIDSFQFPNYQNLVADLEIPLIEYLQYIPQDFYYYQGSEDVPLCKETVSWIIYKTPQIITTIQRQQL